MTDKKAEILRCAKELFSARGFKDTGVAEIMKAAGMAVGTFYNYFTSKDQLFMELFNAENVRLKKSILDTLDLEADPMAVMKEMTGRNLRGMLENPILREWYNREVFQKLEQNYREENAVECVDFLYDSFIDVVRKWQADGKMRRDISPELIMAIFAALVSVDTHKAEIGLHYFPQVLDYMSEFTMKGLMDTGA
ncbi:transcriptional regulator, TetR family [Sporobacter termitidis DSM 10068]|uniref:Transcriptional regulator, TetR family n=1 Tax=Sporobacter termitidis DSM 10068 TaxID=1123282 RepID=A0A1M5Z257_9FIRM|nr:TetR/AcrR family transcriptional regulator [Sporobacter termitidis]SHI18178.1 transcriptional regulator, TetR family [Sporobacter termitidis DSM 10068]